MGTMPPIQLQVGLPAPGLTGAAYVPKQGTTPQDEAEKKEIERLRSTSDLYKVYQPEWELFLAAYEGGVDIANERHLFKHARENDEDFLDRVKRTHYLNYCEPIVSFFTNFIMAETIQRDGGSNAVWYDTFITDVNRKGWTIDQFMSEVCDNFQVFGMSYTLVDAPKLPEGQKLLTVQDEQDLKIDPYLVLITPDEIIDWVTDDFDKFVYVKRKQIVEQMGAGGSKETIERYTEWYLDKVEVSEIDVTDSRNPVYVGKNTIPAPFPGTIPLKMARFKRSKRYPFMGNSMLRDLAYNNRAILNLTSLIDEFNYRQCFNILAKETETTLPTTSQEDGVIGNANVLEYPKGASVPQYISPPADPAEFLQREREHIKQEMFRRAAQDTLNEIFNGEQKSGFSQAQSFSKTVPFIANRADILEHHEIEVMQLVMRFKSKTWDGKIKYKDRYELTNLTDAISQLAMLAKDLQIQSPTFIKEELKRFVYEYDGKLKQDPKKMKTILDEVDAMDMDKWFETQKEALIGQPKPAPGQAGQGKGTSTTAEAAAEAKTQGNSATK